MPGETTNMKFSVDNSEGALSFISVNCELIEKTVLGNNRFYFTRHPVAVNFPGFKARGNLLEQVAQLTLPPYSQQNAKTKKLHQKKATYWDMKKIVYPKNEIVPTTLGKIVNISYSLAVELIYDGCCSGCFDKALAHIPVQIFITDFFKLEPTVEAPMGWAPQVMPTVNLSLGPLNESYERGNQNNQGTEQQLEKMQIQDNFMKPQTSYDSSTLNVELEMTQRQITD